MQAVRSSCGVRIGSTRCSTKTTTARCSSPAAFSNQGTFYPRFDAVVLLSAPADVILERVGSRETNEFGKSDAERDRILDDLAKVEPVLRAGAIAEIDTRVPLDEVVDALERIADTVARR
jgi:thymidylate kinase